MFSLLSKNLISSQTKLTQSVAYFHSTSKTSSSGFNFFQPTQKQNLKTPLTQPSSIKKQYPQLRTQNTTSQSMGKNSVEFPFPIPEIVSKSLAGTKSNWDPKVEWQLIYNALKELSLIELQLLQMFFIADMSYGALSLPAKLTLDFAMNAVRYLIEKIYGIKADGPFSSSGEGGGLPELLGTMFSHYRAQMASGGFGINVLFIQTAISFILKLGQSAKPTKGGVLGIAKLLQNIEVAKLRGFIPPDATQEELNGFIELFKKSGGIEAVNSPNAMNKSIEELIELFRVVLELNPNLKALHLKIPVNAELESDLAGFAKVLLTAVQTYPGLFQVVQLYIDLAGFGGGTANTKRHYQMLSHSALEGLIQFLTTMSEGDLHHYVKPTIDGMILTGEQVAKYLLVRLLVDDNGKIKFGIANSALWGAACEQLFRCHLPFPMGCAKGTASHHPEDLKRFDGTPFHVVDIMLNLFIKPATKILIDFGITDLDNPPPPSEIAKMISRIPVESGEILLEKAKLLTSRKMTVEKKTPPTMRTISHELEDELIEKFTKGELEFSVDKPARDFFGGALTTRYQKQETSKPIRVEFTQHGGHWFGAFTEKGVTLKANGKVDDSCARFSGGTNIVNGSAGDKAGECLKWGGRLLLKSSGHYFGRQAQGGLYSVCQIGAFAFEDARTVDAAFIWGMPRHYSGLGEDSRQSFEVLNPHTIGKDFGKGMFSFRGYMPEKLFIETLEKGFFTKAVVKGHIPGKDLTDAECRMLYNELEYFQNEIPVDYLQTIFTNLRELFGDARNELIRSHFCKIQVGPNFGEIKK